MTALGPATDLFVLGAIRSALPAVAQAGGAESGGISGIALWVGLLVLLVIFLAIIIKAFGQRRAGYKELEAEAEPEALPPAEEERERKPSLREIKEARAQKLTADRGDKDALLKARQARKGASRALIDEEAVGAPEEVDAVADDVEAGDAALAESPLEAPSLVAPVEDLVAPAPAELPEAESAEGAELPIEKPRLEPVAERPAPEPEVEKPRKKTHLTTAELPKLERKPVPKKPELVEPEPKKPEPVKPEPVKPEPKKPEPKKPEPKKPEPKKPEPKKPEPKKPEVVKPEPKSLRDGLAQTRSGFFGRLRGLFAREKAIDATLMAELEEVLLTADIGVKTSMKLLEAVERKVADNGEVGSEQVWDLLRTETARILSSIQRPLVIGEQRPFVILVIGVNGVGKTTTVGKLASRYKGEGHKVMLVAGDTFRAAAIDQLKIWGTRTGCEVFAGDEGADPSGIVFDGVKRALETGVDVVLIDTAGRLHTKVNLVGELKKASRVCGKALPGSPHETLLVLDANTGQNAINQAEMFGKEVGVTGIALTKLDGTAKGGVVIGICDELGVPVQFIGIGEQLEDLREFDADEFVDAVF
jgi:fused signal recognition particle receptor